MLLYDYFVMHGCDIDHHYSDLYVRYEPNVAIALFEYCMDSGDFDPEYYAFMSDGERWLEFPFQYIPYWHERLGK